MAAGEGFEPSQTESESVVLPLHNPAISCSLVVSTNAIIANNPEMSRENFLFFKKKESSSKAAGQEQRGYRGICTETAGSSDTGPPMPT